MANLDDVEDARFDALVGATTCRLCEDVLDEDLSCLPCGHCFEKPALLTWFQDHRTCPVCRHEVEA